MIIYIDSDYKCHAEPDEGLTAVEDAFFDGKCKRFIEGHRLVPEGAIWTRSDGEVFSGGKMISPWKDYTELDTAQRKYERDKLADAENALAILLGGEPT